MAADIAKATSPVPSLATLNPSPSNQLTKEAAADIAAGDMLYLTSAGKFDLTDGTANDAKAKWIGMAARAAKSGQPVTAYFGVEFHYGSGLTPSARYYVSATAGALYDTTTTGGTVPCAFATSATTVFVIPPVK